MVYQMIWAVFLGVMTPAIVAMEDLDLTRMGGPDFSTSTIPTNMSSNQPSKKEAISQPSGPLTWQDQPESAGKPGAAADEGITTINEARGNWFFKVKIQKDARKLYDKISKKVATFGPLQEKYLNDRIKMDTVLNEFYQMYGFTSGEIDSNINAVVDQLKTLETSTSPLDDQEKALLVESKKRKEELAAFKKDFDHLQKLESALSQSLATMSTQVTKASTYSEQAWDYVMKIEDTLSDEAAEELLNKTQVAFDNILAIEAYLSGDFNNFFVTTSQKLMQQVDLLKQKLVALKDLGVALGKKMKGLLEAETALSQAQELQEIARRAKEKERANRTWLSPILDSIAWVWVVVRNSVVSVYETIVWWFSSKKEVEKPVTIAAPLEPEPVQEPTPSQSRDSAVAQQDQEAGVAVEKEFAKSASDFNVKAEEAALLSEKAPSLSVPAPVMQSPLSAIMQEPVKSEEKAPSVPVQNFVEKPDAASPVASEIKTPSLPEQNQASQTVVPAPRATVKPEEKAPSVPV